MNLLSQLEVEQKEQGAFGQFLDMHMYVTSALSKTDIKAIGLQMALDLIHKKEKKDLITGLHTRTQAGRPDWDKVYPIIECCGINSSSPIGISTAEQKQAWESDGFLLWLSCPQHGPEEQVYSVWL